MNRILVLIFFVSLPVKVISQDHLTDCEVEIIFLAEKSIFPVTWLTKEINARATPLDSGEFERTRTIIVKALKKYPVELIKRNLTKIYVVGELEFYGQSYGGTNSTAEVYITNRGKAMGYSDFWIETAFHSEFSSILLRNYSFLFDKKKWQSINKSIRYGRSGTDALRQKKASVEFDLELNEKGILAQYGTASIEEDFNLFAENLFLSRFGFWEIEKTQKRIRKKVNLVIKFYNQIDNSFDEQYFRDVSKK